MKQYATIGDTVYFWFAGNDTSGSGGDGASPAADVRLAGAAADAIPVLSPTPTLLTHANYPAGCYELAVAATAANGFAANNTYAVFCTLAIDGQNPTGFIGSFDLKAVKTLLTGDPYAIVNHVDYGNAKLVRSTTPANALDISATGEAGLDFNNIKDATGAHTLTNITVPTCTANSDMRGTDGANTTVPDAAGTAAALHTTTDGHLTDLKGTGFVKDTHSQPQCLTATGFNTVVPDAVGIAAALHATTDGKIDTNKTELDGLQGTDGRCAISTDAQDLSGTFDVNTKTVTATALDLILKDSIFAVAMAAAHWDRILTGATHNIPTSAGRRVREIAGIAISTGMAQAGTSISITLAADANGGDGVFNRNLLVILAGAGKGQTRTIIDYNDITKECIIDREWRINPDNTSEYQILADDTPLVVDQGVARGGTLTTIILREYAPSTDSIYLCNIVIIVAGAGRGQARLVGAYNGITKEITICGDNWAIAPNDTSVYVMIPYGAACVGCINTSALDQINTEVDNALDTAIPGSPTADSINQKVKALPSGIAKNVALPFFDFYMLLEDGLTAATGKTVTGQIRKDNGAFAAITNVISEVGSGLYAIASGFTQAEMNANKVTLKFTADGCKDTIFVIYPT